MNACRRLLLFISAAALVLVIWLLAESRPPLPPTDGLGAATGADRLLVFLAWLGSLLLALGLLYRTAVRARGNRTLPPAPMRHLYPHRLAARALSTSGYPDRAFPVILRPRPVPDERDAAAQTPAPDAIRPAQPTPADRSPSQATISLLGPLTISGTRRAGRRLRGATRELLSYLALHPAGAHRDQIIDALWPDETPEHGRNRLWRAAADARNHLGETTLRREGEHYALDRNQVSIDLDRLEQLLTELERAAGIGQELPLLDAALALFTGEPLAGSDSLWVENEQRRLHAIELDLLERASGARLASGDAAGALARAEAGLSYEPYNERLARLAMQAESALGLRGAIIDRYENLTQLLDAQLGLQPHHDTRRLYRQLLSQDHRQEPAVSSDKVGANLPRRTGVR